MTAVFGEWLARQLASQGWGPTEAARQMGISHGMVSQWLSGVRHPSARSIRRIAAGLRIDPEVVMEIAGHLPPGNAPQPDSDYARIIGLVNLIDWDADPLATDIARRMLEGILQSQEERGIGGNNNG